MPTNPPPPLSERLLNCADARFEQARVARSPLAALRFTARALDLIERACEASIVEQAISDFASHPAYQNPTRSDLDFGDIDTDGDPSEIARQVEAVYAS